LEHVEEPVLFVRELTRVLRPGGAFLARTVSRFSPLAVLSRAIPERYHAWVLARAQPGRLAQDVFPATYRMNSHRALGALLDANYEWSTSTYPALKMYALPWPRLATAIAAFERHLPRSTHLTLLVSARLNS
jgi:SAM-dependent methyltransferase